MITILHFDTGQRKALLFSSIKEPKFYFTEPGTLIKEGGCGKKEKEIAGRSTEASHGGK